MLMRMDIVSELSSSVAQPHDQLKTLTLVALQYPKGVHRSMEDIKARYYAVARQLLVGREGTEDSVANNVLVKHPFNLTHER